MAKFRFLSGTGFSDKAIPFSPGRIYLDTSTGALWFDDPNSETEEHGKVIDLDALIFSVENEVEVSFDIDSTTTTTTARLGTARLGSMKLGQG